MNKKRKQIKVLIVEDHLLARKGLKMILDDQGLYSVVGEAENGEDGIKLARLHRPDLVIADIGLPMMNGLEYTRRLLKLLPRTRVLLLSVHRDRAIVAEAIRIGVAGYLLKEDADTLPQAMKMIMSGERYLSPSLSTVVADIIMSTGSPVIESGDLEKLSLREIQVLSMTVAGKTKSEIAKKLFISADTVKTHRVRIKRKLKLKSFDDVQDSTLKRYLSPP